MESLNISKNALVVRAFLPNGIETCRGCDPKDRQFWDGTWKKAGKTVNFVTNSFDDTGDFDDAMAATRAKHDDVDTNRYVYDGKSFYHKAALAVAKKAAAIAKAAKLTGEAETNKNKKTTARTPKQAAPPKLTCAARGKKRPKSATKTDSKPTVPAVQIQPTKQPAESVQSFRAIQRAVTGRYSYRGESYRIERWPELYRVGIQFDGPPSPGTLETLRTSGLNYSPKLRAWIKRDNAKTAAIIDAWRKTE